MEKFKVGDKVKVKKSAKVGDIYNGMPMSKSMVPLECLIIRQCYPDCAKETVFCSNGFYYGQDALTKVK